MPTLEINATQPWLIAPDGNVSEITRLAVMNLALRGIEADFGPEHADTFRRDLHPKEVLHAFDNQVPLFQQVHANLHQPRTLATLRDTLLTKLKSGELSIAKAQEVARA